MATQTCEPGDSGDVMWPGIKNSMFREIKKGNSLTFQCLLCLPKQKTLKESVLTNKSILPCN